VAVAVMQQWVAALAMMQGFVFYYFNKFCAITLQVVV
jgi:hypothetical protein